MKFRKKPIVVEAIQYYGNQREVEDYFGTILAITNRDWLAIPTLEGTMYAKYGDWVIKGVNGEFYPCKDDIFRKTYEPVDA